MQEVSYKSYAKINIFLKIIGYKDTMHQVASRFMLIKNLYDEIHFTKSDKNYFDLVGDFRCRKQKNTIYKTYELLLQYCPHKPLVDFFKTYKITVKKNIPIFSGLGGASSNAAVFLKAVNTLANLKLNQQDLFELGSKVGADVNFFISEFESANVYGFGERIEEYQEKYLETTIKTPKVSAMTAAVFAEFRQNFHHNMETNKHFSQELTQQNSQDILKKYPKELLNDLYYPALNIYPKLKEYNQNDYFFSGSGSSFFKVKSQG